MNDEVYEKIAALSRELTEICTKSGRRVATAESCTGGMISAAITGVSGSSAVIELGVCSYSNRIKRDILGVSPDTLARCSEYSIECAEEMAEGARRLSGADYAVSTTGVAGPSGGSAAHPVGEVFIAVSSENGVEARKFLFRGDRESVRAEACKTALECLLSAVFRETARSDP